MDDKFDLACLRALATAGHAGDDDDLVVNSIEFQQTVQQSISSYRVSFTLLKILLNVQSNFN